MALNATEHRVWRALRDQALPGEVVLTSVRFTDAKGGDVEADLIVLIPHLGAAIIEVKGGKVEYRDGQWTTTNRQGSMRRIHPVEQARRGKHALRRFLDRQPEWQRGLLRTEWFVAMPQTRVDTDLGSEAPRDRLIDRGDLGTALAQIRDVLSRSLDHDRVPDDEWIDDAVSLIMRLPQGPEPEPPPLVTWRSILAGLGAFAICAAVVIAAGWWGLAAVGLVGAGGAGWYLWRGRKRPAIGPLVVAAVTGLIVGTLGGLVWNVTYGAPECAEGYEPCLPVRDDLDCSQVGQPVRVTGVDQYDLDRNGDGIGCEEPASAP